MTHASAPAATTIAAPATAPAPSGIAVVRISGPEAGPILSRVFHGAADPLGLPRQLVYGEIKASGGSDLIDRGLAVFMPGPRSFTGEDTAELHLHGSPVAVQKLLRALFAAGAAPAEPGEFTKRAFLNGKLDLVQAEAVCDLINASSEQALKAAGRQLEGALSRALAEIAEPLRDALAEIEAELDFPEEEITPLAEQACLAAVPAARGRIQRLLATFDYGHAVREGFRVLLWGRPNVGKSSLLNALLEQERAIVTETAGTTRDLIEEAMTIGGYRFVFCDAAGISENPDKIEKIGMELARQRIAWADLVLCMADAADDRDDWRSLRAFLEGSAKAVWLAANKIDLIPPGFKPPFGEPEHQGPCFYLSALTGEGLEQLKEALVEEVEGRAAERVEAGRVLTNERHFHGLQQADRLLARAQSTVAEKLPLEITSIELRQALSALEELVGKTTDEDILGRIFSRFCVGK